MKELIFLPLVFGNLVVSQQLIKEARPLYTEQVSTGKGTITADYNQIGDATGDQVVSSFETTLSLSKIIKYDKKHKILEKLENV